MNKNPSYFQVGRSGADKVKNLDTKRFPIEMVSWDNAQVFCKKMRETTLSRGRFSTSCNRRS